LFHVSFVSFGKPHLKTVSFSSENNSLAYFSLSRAESAFLDLRLGTLTLQDQSLAVMGEKHTHGLVLGSPHYLSPSYGPGLQWE
jgi:hypothetical protein